MRVYKSIDELSFEVDTGHRPKKGVTVYKVVLLENAKKALDIEKKVGAVEELKLISKAFEGGKLFKTYIENRLLELEKGELK